MHAKSLQSCLTLCNPKDYFATRQAPLSMGFSRQEHWSGSSRPPLGNLSRLGMELPSLTSPELTGRFFTTSTTWEALK